MSRSLLSQATIRHAVSITTRSASASGNGSSASCVACHPSHFLAQLRERLTDKARREEMQLDVHVRIGMPCGRAAAAPPRRRSRVPPESRGPASRRASHRPRPCLRETPIGRPGAHPLARRVSRNASSRSITAALTTMSRIRGVSERLPPRRRCGRACPARSHRGAASRCPAGHARAGDQHALVTCPTARSPRCTLSPPLHTGPSCACGACSTQTRRRATRPPPRCRIRITTSCPT